MEFKNIASYIDHTNLKPDAAYSDIFKLCNEAIKYEFYTVCVNPYFVSYASDNLKSSPVKVASVIGFPLGASTSDVKEFETKKALENGADEIDMVINISALKNKEFDYLEREISGVVKCADKNPVKVIIETCLLSEEEKKSACRVIKSAGAQFVKTSTGFSSGGAAVEDVSLLRKEVGSNLKVKASGGIKSYEDAVNMLKAGADRIGTSSGVKIAAGIT